MAAFAVSGFSCASGDSASYDIGSFVLVGSSELEARTERIASVASGLVRAYVLLLAELFAVVEKLAFAAAAIPGVIAEEAAIYCVSSRTKNRGEGENS